MSAGPITLFTFSTAFRTPIDDKNKKSKNMSDFVKINAR